MELTPENIVDQIKQLLPEMAEFEDSDGNLIQGSPIPWLVNLIREHGEQLLEAEQNKLISQVKSLTTDQLHEPAEAFRIAGKIEGLKMGIENIRQTLKSK